jgi:cytochrome P450
MFATIKSVAFAHIALEYPIFKHFLEKFVIPKSFAERRRQHVLFAEQKVKKRMALDTDRKDFMSYIFKRKGTEVEMSESEIVSTAAGFVRAGSETTATFLSGTTYHLGKNHEALRKATEEVRGAFASEEDINFISASKLKYLLACLHEGYRMYPVVPIGLPRIVPKGGDTIAGYFVPEGVRWQ